jgi:hypothetical protein
MLKEAAMIRRAFEDKGAQITFTKDFHETVMGDLLPGKDFIIYYDADRLPQERSTYNGLPAWSIVAYVKFSPSDQPKSFPLESETGIVTTKRTPLPEGGTMMKTQVRVPANAQEVILWFVNSGRSGAVYYDSDYGRNYTFRFVSRDIRVLSATVVSDPQTPYSGFGVEVSAAPEISQVSVHFTVLNNPVPFSGTVALQKTGSDNIWSASGIGVPYRAVIRFEILYVVDGSTYTDDNHGQGYLAGGDQVVTGGT